MSSQALPPVPLVIERYALFDRLASGGMATVYLGRLLGSAGLGRTVAIKRLHAHLATDPEYAHMLLDEARIAMRIRHPNVVPTLDVAQLHDELLIVMEFVEGVALWRMLKLSSERGARLPVALVTTVLSSVLHGLHAAHDVKSERGEPLGVVHRDVSPQNILVGADGVARLLDFGIAKAAGKLQTTRDNVVKGKLAYMAPEQLQGHDVDRRTDVFAAGIVLWEALTGERLFAAPNEGATIARILDGQVTPPSAKAKGLTSALDAICARALARSPGERFATAREMALALEACGNLPASEIARWVESNHGDELAKAHARVVAIEAVSQDLGSGVSLVESQSGSHETELSTRQEVRRHRATSTRGRTAAAAGVLAGVVAVGVWAARTLGAQPSVHASTPLPKTLPPAITEATMITAVLPPEMNETLAPAPTTASARLRVAAGAPSASASASCVIVPIVLADGTRSYKQQCP